MNTLRTISARMTALNKRRAAAKAKQGRLGRPKAEKNWTIRPVLAVRAT